jgi:hypothetical protein
MKRTRTHGDDDDDDDDDDDGGGTIWESPEARHAEASSTK